MFASDFLRLYDGLWVMWGAMMGQAGGMQESGLV